MRIFRGILAAAIVVVSTVPVVAGTETGNADMRGKAEIAAGTPVFPATRRPERRAHQLPRAGWERQADGALWTRVAMTAALSHGRPLIEMVPEDIADWCPAYADQPPAGRAAFWAGLISSLARYESTWRESAVGGGGRWFGLMQIQPSTARAYGCAAGTGKALLDGPANLSCAVRIMSETVPRDRAIAVRGSKRWRGVAADWGPIRDDGKRRAMQRYTARQTYCRPLGEVYPVLRPGLSE